jgi:MerR family transcriptional regulator/heat shock protein HspR
MRDPFELTDDAPVYVISVAAQLSGLHPQTLRQYDRMGLVSPGRTAGRGRRYSSRDIFMLREVQRLSQDEGINLAGIKRILELEHEVAVLRERVLALETDLAQTLSAAAAMLSQLSTRRPQLER